MTTKIFFFGFVALIIFSNYGYSQAENDTLKATNEEVKLVLDRYLAADIIGAEVDKAFLENDYSLVKQKLKLLFAKYPEFARNGEYRTMLETIEKIE